ncbi:hypothetical protein RU99_GL002505 [Enterococcus casseliflavus]|nr:hypothetical protein RU99_GL002505 [Enterococcus casseliflavus]
MVFWIPFCLFLVIGSFFIQWRKRFVTTLIAAIPFLFFMVKIFNYRHYEPDSIFIIYLVGLFLSAILLIAAVRRLSKKA